MNSDVSLFEAAFNHLYTSIYITDIEDDRIVYMNNTMKKTFDIDNPEGSICWQVLQKEKKQRCSFCKIDTLLKDRKKKVCVWKEENELTGRIFRSYDSLFEWQGKVYHIQNSVDITGEIKLWEHMNLDELTGMPGRRDGKEHLQQYIERGKKEQKQFVVVLLDINKLKVVNDNYGHSEGDVLICRVASGLKSCLTTEDFCFRLSSDEFIVVYYDEERRNAEERVVKVQMKLKEEQDSLGLSYEMSFSFGLVEIYPGDQSRADDIIARADRQMYRQKRSYHIEKAKEQLQNYNYNGQKQTFEYDVERLYDALIESTDDYIFVGNMKTGVFRYSQAMVEEFGLPGQVVENAAAFWGGLIHPHDEAAFLESNQEIADGRADHHDIEYRAKNVKGEWIWLRCKGKLIVDTNNTPSLFAGFITNLGILNKRDHMTGLYNRFELEGNVKKYIVDEDHPVEMGLMVLNMDGFKNINDLYNRSFGDAVLKLTAQKLTSLMPANARLFRLDGDEFGILLLNAAEEEREILFQRIREEFSKPQEFDGRKYYCTLSGGYSSYPKDADNYLDLIKYANYSLERSKIEGKNRLTLFQQEVLQEKAKRLELTELLRESIERGFVGFSVCYQPQVDAATGSLYGAEALARWRCDEYGVVSPGEFIPLLEECGLIVQLGRWIFEQALTQCYKWLNNWPEFHMSINLSYRQLMEDDVLLFVKELLKKTGVTPTAVTVELTETYLVKEDRVAKYVMEGLQCMGLQAAMDDFGTGYSSLFSLKSIPVDIVKIDREFAKGICNDNFNVTFIKAITELCHNAGKRVCLEGIETDEEYQIIKKHAMLEFIQGYFFGRPMKAADFEEAFGK